MNSWKALTIFAKCSILDFCGSSESASQEHCYSKENWRKLSYNILTRNFSQDKLPFVPNAPFLYPLKTFWCFQGVEKGCIGNEWVNEEKYQGETFNEVWFDQSCKLSASRFLKMDFGVYFCAGNFSRFSKHSPKFTPKTRLQPRFWSISSFSSRQLITGLLLYPLKTSIPSEIFKGKRTLAKYLFEVRMKTLD